MKISMRIQLLTCLLVCVSSAHGIMVKFGTKGGPIEPPTPEPQPPPQPYRAPAPVWEERSNDAPDPNAHWRPQLFIPQPRYTQVVYNVSPPPAQPLNNAQRFVNSYRPLYQPKAQTVQNYISPSQFLSSQNLPGVGIRYFVPAYVNDLHSSKEQKKQDDAKQNEIETNNIDGSSHDSPADLQWKYEKDFNRRVHRNAQELLTCLLVCVSSAHGIMVKFGTKGGPIEPPTPEPQPPPQPYRAPAPVWEERSNDAPDPNAHWRPQLFIPQPRYTQVVYNVSPPPAQPLNNAQRFVNSYRPLYQPKAQTVQNYISPSQFLSSQNLPGVGIRYFVPAYVNDLHSSKEQKKQDDAKQNEIETNNIDGSSHDSPADLQWKYEKDFNRRVHRNAQEGTARQVYQWPLYVHPRH